MSLVLQLVENRIPLWNINQKAFKKYEVKEL